MCETYVGRTEKIIRDLAEKLPVMTERERGYLEGTIATAAAMSKKGEKMEIQGTEIQIKDYKGKRVVTFKDILITPDESESYKTP